MTTLLKKKEGRGNHRKKMKDFVMIGKIVLIGLIQGRKQGMEEMIEMAGRVIGVTLKEKGELIKTDM